MGVNYIIFIVVGVAETARRDQSQRGEGGGHLLHPPTRRVHRHAPGTDTFASIISPSCNRNYKTFFFTSLFTFLQN